MSNPDMIANQKPMRLNVGCGHDLKPFDEGWVNLDINPNTNCEWVHDLDQDLEDQRPELRVHENLFDEIYMSHVLEHFRNPLLAMTKLWTVAKPGAKCVIKVPYGSSDNAFEDPTHYRQYFIGSFQYFSQAAYHRADYGYRADWKIVSRKLHIPYMREYRDMSHQQLLHIVNTFRNVVQEMEVVLEAQKPIRTRGDWHESSPITFAFFKD